MATIVVPAEPRCASHGSLAASYAAARLFEKLEDDIHVGLRRNKAAQARVNDTATRFDRGNVAQVARRIKYGPGRVDQHSLRCGRIWLIDDHFNNFRLEFE